MYGDLFAATLKKVTAQSLEHKHYRLFPYNIRQILNAFCIVNEELLAPQTGHKA